MKLKEESEKVSLKLNIQKMKMLASHPITSWQIEGEKMEAMADILFLGSRITVDGDCSHEIKRLLLQKIHGKPRQNIKKQRHHFADKGLYNQSYVFPVVMYGCEVGP